MMKSTDARGAAFRLATVLTVALLTVSHASGGVVGAREAGEADAAVALTMSGVDRDEVGANGLLTPAAIVARFVDAIGGEEVARSHTSATSKGRFVVSAMGMEGDMVIYTAAPDKLVMNVEVVGIGSTSNGYNGEVGWSVDPMTGPALLDGALLEQMQRESVFYGPLQYDDLYPTQETVELTDFDGQSAYKVRMESASGVEVMQFYSQESGLLIGTQGVQSSAMGDAEVTAMMRGYKDFDGLLSATEIVADTMGMEVIQTTSEIVWNEIPEGAFELPDSVRALLEE